jgi:hypothetical protein
MAKFLPMHDRGMNVNGQYLWQRRGGGDDGDGEYHNNDDDDTKTKINKTKMTMA